MADGLKSMLDGAGGAPTAAGAAEQLSLLGAAPAEAASERGVGRPKGSLNKRSRDWQRWWRESGKTHPLEFLAEVISSSPEQLRDKFGALVVERSEDGKEAVFGLSARDILAMQIRAAEAALPYLEQKLPMAIEDVSEGKRTIVVIGQMTLAQQAQLGVPSGVGLRLANGTGRGEQNQGVIEAQATPVGRDQSDEPHKPMTEQDKSHEAS